MSPLAQRELDCVSRRESRWTLPLSPLPRGVCGPSEIAKLIRKLASHLPHVLRCVACLTLACHSGSDS